MLEATHIHKSAEMDNYEQGCVGGGQDFTIPHTISADTAENAARQLCEFAGASFVPDNYELNSCGEPGRIDVFTTENGDGTEPNGREIEEWKRGERQLFYCTYTAYVQQVTRETVELV